MIAMIVATINSILSSKHTHWICLTFLFCRVIGNLDAITRANTQSTHGGLINACLTCAIGVMVYLQYPAELEAIQQTWAIESIISQMLSVNSSNGPRCGSGEHLHVTGLVDGTTLVDPLMGVQVPGAMLLTR